MKRTFKLITAVFAAVTLLLCLSAGVFASIAPVSEGEQKLEKAYSSHFKQYKGEDTEEWGDYVLAGRLTVKKDHVIAEGSHVYLKKGSILIIKNDADINVKGTLTIEQGAKVYITDGTLGIEGICDNYGKLIIREKGLLAVNGCYSSGGYSRIRLGGKAKFGSAYLDEVLAKIATTDKSFGLDSCAVSYSGKMRYVKLDRLELTYRIGNVLTDHYYRLDPTNDLSRLKSSDIPLKTAYSSKTADKVTAAVNRYFEKTHTLDKFADNKYIFGLDTRLFYSFETSGLEYEEIYFEFGLSPIEDENGEPEGMFYDSGESKKIKV